MICLVCLKESTCYLNIFDGSGKDVGISDVLQKHFWFQPKPDDSISTVICTLCWTKISDFHQFYTIVEQAHISLQQNAIANDNVYHKFAADALDDGAVLHCEIDVKEELLDVEQAHISVQQNSIANDNVYHKFAAETVNDRTVLPFEVAVKEEILEVCFQGNKEMIEDNKESQKLLLNTQTANEIVDSMDTEEYENPTVSTDKQSMRNHIVIQPQPRESKTYQCEHCPKKFTRPFILEQHQLTHEDHTHICQICQREFPSSNKLKTHILTKHTNYGAEMCDICGEVIHGRTAFLRHQLEHASISLPKVQCDKCGSWHKDKLNLQKHLGSRLCGLHIGAATDYEATIISQGSSIDTLEPDHWTTLLGEPPKEVAGRTAEQKARKAYKSSVQYLRKMSLVEPSSLTNREKVLIKKHQKTVAKFERKMATVR